MAMREQAGRPNDGMVAAIGLSADAEPICRAITVLNRKPLHSLVSEMEHLARKTNDPSERQNGAVRFFSAAYYQKHSEFSDCLTATFAPGSQVVDAISSAGMCSLTFEAFAHRFVLECEVKRLSEDHPFHQATVAHNRLFNAAIPAGIEVIGFRPDWDRSAGQSLS